MERTGIVVYCCWLLGCGAAPELSNADGSSTSGWETTSSSSEGSGRAEAGSAGPDRTTSSGGDGVDDETGVDDSSGSSGASAEDRCVRGDPSAIGDTSPCTRVVFPAEAFWSPEGGAGRIIDVTGEPFNAVGDGVADDTEALRAAYDFVMAEIDRVGWDGFWVAQPDASYVLYIPDGTYRVTDTIIYSGPDRLHPVGVAEALAQVRIIGESRDGTILALDAEVPAFAEGQPPRPVISFGRLDFNNLPGDNALRNLTVRVGPGNPSAVGVKFGGANSSDIENVAIIAEGRGAIGLDNSIGTLLSYQRDLVIEGFAVGVRMAPYHFTRPTLEHVTLRDQQQAGIEFVDGTGTVRSLLSDNEVPAARTTGPGSHAVIVDAQLMGGHPQSAAIELQQGHIFARNVEVTAGYGASVLLDSTGTVVEGDIDEWVSDPTLSFDGSPATSLNLPIAEVPRFEWQDPALWVIPDTAGDGSDDATASIQAAVDSGAPVLAFPGYEYRIDGTVDLPCSVAQVQLLFTNVEGDGFPKFRVLGPCNEPLLVADGTISRGLGFEHAGDRTLVMSRINTTAFPYRNVVEGPGPTVFIDMVTGVKAQNPFHDQTAYIRGFNGESNDGQLRCVNATCWVLGFKTEKSATAMTAVDGAQLEVLGGIFNQFTPQADPGWATATAVVGEDSELSIVAATSGPNDPDAGFEFLVRDTQAATTRQVVWDGGELPLREGRPHEVVVPLYRSP